MGKQLPPSIPYHKEENHLIPNLALSESGNKKTEMFGKFGRLRKEYMREHIPHLYNSLMLSGSLNAHLTEFNRQAWERMERIQQNLLRKNPLPQTCDTMELTRHRRMIHDMAEEIVLNEMVYL